MNKLCLTISKYYENCIFSILLYFILLIPFDVFFLHPSSYLIGSDIDTSYLFPFNLKGSYLYVWDQVLHPLGAYFGASSLLNLPQDLLFVFLKILEISTDNIYKVTLVIFLLFSIFSVYVYTSLFTKSKIARLTFGVFYVYNTIFLIIYHWLPIYKFLTFWSIIPLFLYFWSKFLSKNIQAKNLYILLLLGFFMAPSFTNPVFIIIFVVMVVLSSLINIRDIKLDKYKLIVVALMVGCCAFFLIPTAHQALSELQSLKQTTIFKTQTSQSLNVDNINNTPVNAIKLTGGWGYFNKWYDNEWAIQFHSLYVGIIQWLLTIPFILFVIFVFFEWKKTPYFLVLLIFILMMLFMAQQSPFPVIYDLFLKLPFSFGFRSTISKIGPLIIFFLITFFAKKYSQKLKFFIPLMIIYFFVLSIIFTNGLFVRNFLYQKDISDFTKIQSKISTPGKIAYLPLPIENNTYRFRLANNGESMWIPPETVIHLLHTEQPVISVGQSATNYYEDLYLSKIQSQAEGQLFLADDFFQKFKIMGISEIIIDKRYFTPEFDKANYRTILRQLVNSGLTIKYEDDSFVIIDFPYEQKAQNPNIQVSKIDSVTYAVKIGNLTQPTDVTLNESFDNGWKVYNTRNFLQENEVLSGTHRPFEYKNQWTVDKDILIKSRPKIYSVDKEGSASATLYIYFKPQNYFIIGLFVSALSCVGLFTMALLRKAKRGIC